MKLNESKIITPDGKVTLVTPANGTDFQLDEMQKIVGGYIEIVNLRSGKILVVNEEGLLENLPFNDRAATLAGGPIVGTVLYCESELVK